MRQRRVLMEKGIEQQGTGIRSHGAGATPAAQISVQLRSLSKQYGNFTAVQDVSLDVKRGEFLTFLGPSGSGKTTTLMMLTGFVRPSAGQLLIEGRDVTGEPPHRRNIGMVHQGYALFPHLTVARNVAFPMEVRKCGRAEIQARVKEALAMVRLDGLAERYPSQLSGGQQQRVALARAIVFKPPLLLMDEPLGALDKKLRAHMQVELMKIKSCLDVTVIYVTHDQEEALTMSDRVVVMADGAIQQVGHPRDLYEKPANRFVADFIGDTNIFDAEVVATAGSALTLSLAGGGTVVAHSDRNWPNGARVCAILRPERIRVGSQALSCTNQLEGSIDRVVYIGDNFRLLVTLAGGETVIVKAQNCGQPLEASAGERVKLGWDAASMWLVEAP